MHFEARKFILLDPHAGLRILLELVRVELVVVVLVDVGQCEPADFVGFAIDGQVEPGRFE
jgi:hypothetical protein